MKIENDKYYTSDNVVDICLSELKTVLLKNKFIPTRVIEPSAGNGSFSLKIKNCIAYDLFPEHPSIIKQDFLICNLEYKEGTLVIGNPPFGNRLSLAQKFFKKSIQIADYIAFILPISQLNNTSTFYEFDLIKSIDLGLQKYTDRYLHCCFNVYKRPKTLNKKLKSSLKSVKIIRQDNKNYDSEWFDIRMCYWGNGTIGKILADSEHYSGEYKFQISKEFKEEVIKVLKETDWKSEIKGVAMKRLKQYHIINKLKNEIPNIY